MLIRRAVAADADALSQLARAAKAHWGYPEEWMTVWSAALEIAPAYITGQRVFVADHGGTVAGFCALEDRDGGWTLEHLWVSPSRHGRGIGSALVRRALDEVRTLRPGVVTVISDPHAASFYRRLGAIEAGTVPAPMPTAPERVLPRFEFVVTGT